MNAPTEHNHEDRFIFHADCPRCAGPGSDGPDRPREFGQTEAPRSAPSDHERDALQKAYNGICGVLGRLAEAGWASSTIAAEVEAVRVQLGKVAFDADA